MAMPAAAAKSVTIAPFMPSSFYLVALVGRLQKVCCLNYKTPRGAT